MSFHCVVYPSVLVGLANRGLSCEAANVQSDKELWAITSDNKLVNKHVNQPRSYQVFLRPLCTVCFGPCRSCEQPQRPLARLQTFGLSPGRVRRVRRYWY